MDHYDNPRNSGEMEDHDVVQHGGNSGCGDTLVFYLKFHEDGKRVRDISYTGEGCIISQATASLMTEKVKDLTTDEIKRMGSEQMKSILGKDLVIRRPRCANLAAETIKLAVSKYENIKRRKEILGEV